MKQVLFGLFLILTSLIQAQQTSIVDFEKIEGTIHILPLEKKVKGRLNLDFTLLKNADSIYLDAHQMQAKLLNSSDKKIKLKAEADKIWFIGNFKKGKYYQLSFNYSATPKQTMYFLGWENEAPNQVWTQGQGKYTSHWLPSLDDMNDKIEFDLAYKVPENYQVIANGKLKETETKNGLITYRFDMKNPMSSYLVAVAVGKFEEEKIKSAYGVPIKLYYQPKDSLLVEPTYRYSKEIFDFLVEEIGYSFPWQNYKQIPVRDFLYAGMENTSATIFSNQFVIDSTAFIDRNYVNVNAHELAHQWFGDLVTEKSGKHHWLQEGFATYYALLAEKEVFGEDYFYYKLFETAEQLKEMSDSGKGEALLNAKASSLTFYQKGAWALHILSEKVGRTAFRNGVQNYLLKYAYKNVETDDFLKEIEQASGQDLSQFKKDWLEQSAFKAEKALNALKKSKFINEFLSLQALRKTPLTEKVNQLYQALDFPINPYLGQEVIFQLNGNESPQAIQLYKKAFRSNDLLTRQAIASYVSEIPKSIQSNYESLLQDNSYFTVERALFNLWQNFPENRESYLEQTKNIEGFSDKNVRLLWLTLALVTPEYLPQENGKFYQELSGYTQAHYPYELRENAFGYLYQIESFSKQNYLDLAEGATHHVWRFRKFCRDLIEELAKKEQHRAILFSMTESLPENQKKVLTKILEE